MITTVALAQPQAEPVISAGGGLLDRIVSLLSADGPPPLLALAARLGVTFSPVRSGPDGTRVYGGDTPDGALKVETFASPDPQAHVLAVIGIKVRPSGSDKACLIDLADLDQRLRGLGFQKTVELTYLILSRDYDAAGRRVRVKYNPSPKGTNCADEMNIFYLSTDKTSS